MYQAQISAKAGERIDLPAHGELDASCHVIDEDSILAINAALATGRPLLVRGEPGVGKSQLARAAAEALGRAFVSYTVDSRTETRDLLWTVDSVARLAEAQLMGAQRDAKAEELRAKLAISEFVHPGPLWWAFDWNTAKAQAERLGLTPPFTRVIWKPEHGVVVLIDEIDKADPAIPNGLLDAFGHGRFDVPGHKPVRMNSTRRPLVVITTNEERALPDAFLRRCLVLPLTLPSAPEELVTTLVARGRAHFSVEQCSDAVLLRAANLLASDRERLRNQDLCPPGLAEYLDLVRAVCESQRKEKAQLALMERVAKFVLRKHPSELGR